MRNNIKYNALSYILDVMEELSLDEKVMDKHGLLNFHMIR